MYLLWSQKYVFATTLSSGSRHVHEVNITVFDTPTTLLWWIINWRKACLYKFELAAVQEGDRFSELTGREGKTFQCSKAPNFTAFEMLPSVRL